MRESLTERDFNRNSYGCPKLGCIHQHCCIIPTLSDSLLALFVWK